MNEIKEKCGICNYSHRNVALKIQGVKICYDCIAFFDNLAKEEGRDAIEYIENQVNYILNSNGGKGNPDVDFERKENRNE